MTIHRHTSYPHTNPAFSRTRYSSTSSASSASAKLNEDWTKISDFAERRRIHSRIAQHKYHKKLKKRLEELECCAVSSSASSELKPAELQPSQQSPRQESLSLLPSKSSYTAPIAGDRMVSHQYTRQIPINPPSSSVALYLWTYSAPHAAAYPMVYSTLPCYIVLDTLIPEILGCTCLPPPHSIAHSTGQLGFVPSMTNNCYTDEDLSLFDIGCAAIYESDTSSPHNHTDSARIPTRQPCYA